MGYAYVTDAEAGSVDNNSVTTAGVDTTGATLIVLATSGDTGTTTPTDSKGNTWTLIRGQATGPLIRLYYCVNPTVGAGHTFSISQGSSFPSIAMVAASGAAASPLDQQNSASAAQPGSVTPGEDNELLVTIAAHSAVNPGPVLGAPWTQTAQVTGTAPAYALSLAYEIQTAATARNPTWVGVGSAPDRSIIATFKAGAGGGVTVGADALHHYGEHVMRAAA